jgi:hypothetical protein
MIQLASSPVHLTWHPPKNRSDLARAPLFRQRGLLPVPLRTQVTGRFSCGKNWFLSNWGFPGERLPHVN